MMDVIYESVRESAFGLSMDAIWQHMSVDFSSSFNDGLDRVETFFLLMKELMVQGDIKLARDGVLLSGSIEDQLRALRSSWPKNPGEDDLDGFGLWFLTEAPVGIVWISREGKEIWT